LTANVEANAGTFTSGGTVDVTATTTATIVGNVTGVSTTTANIAGIVVSGTGTLTVTGSVTSSAGNVTFANGNAGIYSNATCTIVVNGAVTGGTGNGKLGIWTGASSNATITITGDVSGGSGNEAAGVRTQGTTAAVTITGNVTMIGQSAFGARIEGSSGSLSVTGNVTAAAVGTGWAISATGANNTVTVVGNVTSANVAAAYGIFAFGASATVTVTGDVLAGLGASAHGINATGASSTVSVIGSATGVSTLSHGILSSATTNGVIMQGDMTDSLNGAVAIYARVFRMSATNSGVTTYTNTVGYPTGTPVTRVSPDNVTGMPAEADVRDALVYGSNSELEGTLAVPPATAVGSGVPVDNTTGTASLSPADVAALVGAQIAAAVSSP
jgi:hypothetical protein